MNTLLTRLGTASLLGMSLGHEALAEPGQDTFLPNPNGVVETDSNDVAAPANIVGKADDRENLKGWLGGISLGLGSLAVAGLCTRRWRAKVGLSLGGGATALESAAFAPPSLRNLTGPSARLVHELLANLSPSRSGPEGQAEIDAAARRIQSLFQIFMTTPGAAQTHEFHHFFDKLDCFLHLVQPGTEAFNSWMLIHAQVAAQLSPEIRDHAAQTYRGFLTQEFVDFGELEGKVRLVALFALMHLKHEGSVAAIGLFANDSKQTTQIRSAGALALQACGAKDDAFAVAKELVKKHLIPSSDNTECYKVIDLLKKIDPEKAWGAVKEDLIAKGVFEPTKNSPIMYQHTHAANLLNVLEAKFESSDIIDFAMAIDDSAANRESKTAAFIYLQLAWREDPERLEAYITNRLKKITEQIPTADAHASRSAVEHFSNALRDLWRDHGAKLKSLSGEALQAATDAFAALQAAKIVQYDFEMNSFQRTIEELQRRSSAKITTV